MLHNRLVNAIKKVGVEVVQLGERQFSATKDNVTITWRTQESWNKPGQMEVICLREPHPMTDAQYDLFMDTYYDSIKGAIYALTYKK